MPATTNFQFPQPAGRDSFNSYTPPPLPNTSPRKQSASGSSFVGSLAGPSRASGQYSTGQVTGPWRLHHTPSIPEIPPPSPVRLGSDHGKLHKRRTSKSSIHNRQSQSRSDVPFSYPDEYPATVNPNALSTRSISRDKVMQGLRKLSIYKGADADTDVIDLSLTTAENQEKSGLRLYSSITDMRSQADANLDSSGRRRGHARTTSQTSQGSYITSPFQPTAPFTLPMRSSAFPHIQPTTQNYVSYYGNNAQGSSQLGLLDSAEMPATTASNAPPMRLDMPSTPSLEGGSQTSTPGATITRPRRGTDRSYDAPTPISRTSTDRAFSFKRSKDEPVDYMTRAASIQAARQAFQDKEEAKARKYEKQEQKALERQQRKDTKEERRQQKHEGEVVERVMTGNSARYSEKDASVYGGAAKNVQAAAALPQPEPEKEQVLSRKKAARSRYRRFITWLKTRLFYLGRGRSDSVVVS